MIALLRGELAVRRGDHVVIVCGGVGYRAAVSAETLRHVGAVGEEVALHTHLIAREDALTLYGFAAEEERELFLLLLAVQAVGPKVALAVLSSLRPRELVAALAAGDSARLQAVPGIGRRTAERIIVELREKVLAEDELATLRSPIVARRNGAASAVTALAGGEPRALARAGLLELGYRPEEADELLREADGESAEELIGAALRGASAGGASA